MTEDQYNTYKKFLISNVILTCVVLFSSVADIVSISKKLNVKESPSSTFRPPINDMCFFGFKSIINSIEGQGINAKQLDAAILSSDLFAGLSRENFFELKGNEAIVEVTPLGDSSKCRITTRDMRGLRSYEIALSHDHRSVHGYVISSINERHLENKGE